MRSRRRKMAKWRVPSSTESNNTWPGPRVSCKLVSHSSRSPFVSCVPMTTTSGILCNGVGNSKSSSSEGGAYFVITHRIYYYQSASTVENKVHLPFHSCSMFRQKFSTDNLVESALIRIVLKEIEMVLCSHASSFCIMKIKIKNRDVNFHFVAQQRWRCFADCIK